MENRKVRYGIISTAGIAPRFIRASLNTDNSVFTAVASRDLAKAREFALKNGLEKAYGSYDELYEDPDIDAVYVPTVNSLHYPCALKALEHSKHVIVEKPMTMTSRQRDELFRVAEEKGLFICEAIKVLFLPTILEVKQIVDSGEYGRIRFLEFHQSYVESRYAGGWHKQKKHGGGVLRGNEAYFLSVCELFCGRIEKYVGLPAFGSYDVEDQMSVTLLLQDNVIASSNVSTDILFDNGLVIYLEKARIVIPDYWKARKRYVYQNGELVKTISHPVDYEMCYELQHYSDCILAGKKTSPVVTPEKSIRYIKITEEILESWE